jgi:hypothetical protein
MKRDNVFDGGVQKNPGYRLESGKAGQHFSCLWIEGPMSEGRSGRNNPFGWAGKVRVINILPL